MFVCPACHFGYKQDYTRNEEHLKNQAYIYCFDLEKCKKYLLNKGAIKKELKAEPMHLR